LCNTGAKLKENIIIRQGLKEFTAKDIALIQEVTKNFPKLTRQELANTICEHLDWVSPSGGLKATGCLRLLERLAEQQLLILPEKLTFGRKTSDKPPKLTQHTIEKPQLKGSLKEFAPIKLHVLSDKQKIQLFNEYIQRYHPLKYKRPFGHWLRYFLCLENEPVGCLLISGAAKALYHRDQWITWSVAQRRKNLSWVINNSRYLIFPWVQIPHLASHILGQLARRVANDWQDRWGYRPVLMETFVDPLYYSGICYQAAGWKNLGLTTGKGLARTGKNYKTTPKTIFVKPLVKEFRTLLCSQQLQGRIIE
jgi:hypothetical protein